jgi:hypothetical protein
MTFRTEPSVRYRLLARKTSMSAAPDHKTRFDFFLNPYEDMAFTRCPLCETKTKLRKLPLAIHVEPQTLRMLDKTCRFCTACELVIVRRSELERLLASMFEGERARVERGDYLVLGTLDRADWRAGCGEQWTPAQALDRVWLFKGHKQFEIGGGWVPRDH